jgi:transketolase
VQWQLNLPRTADLLRIACLTAFQWGEWLRLNIKHSYSIDKWRPLLNSGVGMRKGFCAAMVAEAARPDLVFLTGDLGFMALEPLRDAMGPRFINAGVAEQNMVGVAAGLARSSLRAWTYSIAPFTYARPFEQIRNDVCLHNLPVVMVGNGGGYGYGVMGATHHALEDYGALLTLSSLRAYIPAFDGDIQPVVSQLIQTSHPAYLRLGLDEAPKDYIPPPFAAWRRLVQGSSSLILACGPLVGNLITTILQLPPADRPTLWLVSELPVDVMPDDFLADARRSTHLIVVEEHVANGGVGEQLARQLLLAGAAPRRFSHRCATGYPSGRYGSQHFHRRECGLDAASILAAIGPPAAQ